jgi:hypothetical protein
MSLIELLSLIQFVMLFSVNKVSMLFLLLTAECYRVCQKLIQEHSSEGV